MLLQLLLCKDGVFIHVTTAQADEDVLLPGQVLIWAKVQWHVVTVQCVCYTSCEFRAQNAVYYS